MAHGDAFEVSHVLGHAPRDRVVGADDAAVGLRPDEGDCAIGHRQTATGALIAGVVLVVDDLHVLEGVVEDGVALVQLQGRQRQRFAASCSVTWST